MPATPPSNLTTDTAFFGHPKGLYVCFMTEMWERFSYYGMRALLIFYLTQHFLFSDEKAYLIYGAYSALVYVTPVIGGVLADRYLGSRKAVTFGAILLVLGHLGMAIEGPVASISPSSISRDPFYLQIFYLSLAFIICGVGFLKANISTVVGALYSHDDPRRDSGFTLFYMGINIGAFSSSLLCGWLGQTYGWKYGFGLAGIGMLLGLAVFLRGQQHLQGKAEPPTTAQLTTRVFAGLTREQTTDYGAAHYTGFRRPYSRAINLPRRLRQRIRHLATGATPSFGWPGPEWLWRANVTCHPHLRLRKM